MKGNSGEKGREGRERKRGLFCVCVCFPHNAKVVFCACNGIHMDVSAAMQQFR